MSHLDKVSILGMEEREIGGKCKKIKVKIRNSEIKILESSFPTKRQNWTIKKAEHQRIDAVELWCWRRLLRVPWTVRRSNQSILKEISPEYSSERLMLKLKLQYLAT